MTHPGVIYDHPGITLGHLSGILGHPWLSQIFLESSLGYPILWSSWVILGSLGWVCAMGWVGGGGGPQPSALYHFVILSFHI